MSDNTENERLRYAGGTTRHDGTGDEPQTLNAVDSTELGIENIQPGVGNAQENRPPQSGDIDDDAELGDQPGDAPGDEPDEI